MACNPASANSMAGLAHLLLLITVLSCPLATAADTERPEYKTLQAAKTSELARSPSWIGPEYFDHWWRSNGNAMSNRYAPFTQINTTNVAKLQVAWVYRSQESANIQANPIFVEDMVIFPAPGNLVVAVDGSSGRERWRFRTESKPGIRGLTYWPGKGSIDPRIYVPAGQHLVALTLDGKPVSEFGEGGVAGNGQSLVAPAIAHDIIIYPIIGNAAVEGIDVASGKTLWRTPILEPLPPGDTNDADAFAGGNPWGGISVDETRGLAFVTTGNPSPPFAGITRPGENKHSNSVIALDVSNGKIVWSFQEIAHDLWDKDIPTFPILTQIERDGGPVDVVVAVTKHGNTIVLDRVSGQPIYPWRMRRAPSSTLPGEQTAAYQPDVELPEPFAKQVFTEDDLTDLGPENHAFAKQVLDEANAGFFPTFAEGKDTIFFGLRGGAEWPGGAVDPFTGVLYVCSNDVPWRMQLLNVAGLDQIQFPDTAARRSYLEHCARCHGAGLEGQGNKPALYGIEQRRTEKFVLDIVLQGRRMMPGYRNLPDSDVKDIVAYIRSVKPAVDEQRQRLQKTLGPVFQFTGWRVFRDHEGFPASKPPWGWLNALNLHTGRIAWKVPLGTDIRLEKRGRPELGTENLAGPVVTGGGLVFVSGTTDNLVRAFDAQTGEELWRHELPFMGSAAPLVYVADGRQYLLVPATGGTLDNPVPGNSFVAFALPAEDDG